MLPDKVYSSHPDSRTRIFVFLTIQLANYPMSMSLQIPNFGRPEVWKPRSDVKEQQNTFGFDM